MHAVCFTRVSADCTYAKTVSKSNCPNASALASGIGEGSLAMSLSAPNILESQSPIVMRSAICVGEVDVSVFSEAWLE